MKKFAIVLVLIMICAIPASSATCRNGRMTIYHNSEFGYYPNNHVYANNSYPNNHVYNNGDKPKPVYTYKGNVYVSEEERDEAVKNDKNILKVNNKNPLLL